MDTRKRWITGGRQAGKTLLAEEMERDFIKDHRDAVIVRYTADGVIVEKPVQAIEESLPMIEDKANG